MCSDVLAGMHRPEALASTGPSRGLLHGMGLDPSASLPSASHAWMLAHPSPLQHPHPHAHPYVQQHLPGHQMQAHAPAFQGGTSSGMTGMHVPPLPCPHLPSGLPRGFEAQPWQPGDARGGYPAFAEAVDPLGYGQLPLVSHVGPRLQMSQQDFGIPVGLGDAPALDLGLHELHCQVRTCWEHASCRELMYCLSLLSM